MERNIVNMPVLLSLIAAGLNKLNNHQLGSLEVRFLQDGEVVLKTNMQTALDYLANDVYWDENSDWSLANTAEVGVL